MTKSIRRPGTTMAASSSLPLAVAVLFLLLLVLVASAVPTTATGGKYSGGARMVIIRGSGAGTKVGGGAAGAQSNRWRQQYRRLEDEVAPELGGLLGTGEGGIGYGALDPNKPGCQSSNQCAAKGPGGSYTRGCTYESRCPHTPAGVAN